MKKFTTADRLRQLMNDRGLKQVDILDACKPYCKKYRVQLRKNDLSQYVSGKVEPKQDKLSILGLALNVNEVWLMGYDVPAGKGELNQPRQEGRGEDAVSNMIEQYYGKEALKAISMFLKLDALDQGKVIERMEILLEAEKYFIKEELLSKRAI